MHTLLDFYQHFEKYLIAFLVSYNLLAYFTLAVFAFLQTGVILAATLPGDTVLIAGGSVAAITPKLMNVHVLFFLCSIAATCGNLFNYVTGKWIGRKLMYSRTQKFVDKENIKKARELYHKWGGKIVILGCIIPFLRSIIPFVSGMVKMPFKTFAMYSAFGGSLWVGLEVYGSYLLNDVPMIQDNIFTIFIIVILVTTVLPAIRLGIYYFTKK